MRRADLQRAALLSDGKAPPAFTGSRNPEPRFSPMVRNSWGKAAGARKISTAVTRLRLSRRTIPYDLRRPQDGFLATEAPSPPQLPCERL